MPPYTRRTHAPLDSTNTEDAPRPRHPGHTGARAREGCSCTPRRSRGVEGYDIGLLGNFLRQGCPTVRPQSAPWQADLSNSLPGCSSYFLQQVPRIRARSIRDQQGERLRYVILHGMRRDVQGRGGAGDGIPNGGMCGDAPVHGGYGVIRSWGAAYADVVNVESERRAGEKWVQRRRHRVWHARDSYAEPGLRYVAFFWGAICVCRVVYTYFDMPKPQGCSFVELDLLFQRAVSVRKFTSTRAQYSPPSPNRFRSLQLPLQLFPSPPTRMYPTDDPSHSPSPTASPSSSSARKVAGTRVVVLDDVMSVLRM
ncbi:hypothetical protein C8J57DRAFT_1521458 [Mycena rebaudengoi]|nr:hypothetical protein C8J57DRAFT_1521458 [Mycena rebaudengoi]